MPQETVSLTPSAYLEVMTAQINSLQEGSITVAKLTGIPIKPDVDGKSYGGYKYAKIRDPFTADTIDVRISDHIFDEIEWGHDCTMIGVMNYKVTPHGDFRPLFKLDSIESYGNIQLLSKDELSKRWLDMIVRPKRDLSLALSLEKPRIAIITGAGSVAMDDIQSQLKGLDNEVEFVVHRVSMSDPKLVASTLRSCTDVELIVLTRGGGPDVHLLDDETLIEAIASSAIPVAAALGHSTDDLIAARVADTHFVTPTAFGSWLHSILSQKKYHHENDVLGKAKKFNRLLIKVCIGLVVLLVIATIAAVVFANS